MHEHLNPPCLKCSKQPNYRGNSDCTCNNEIRCSGCKHCRWCIDQKLNGKCVENDKADPHRCVNLRPHHPHHPHHKKGLSKKELYIIIGSSIGGLILIIIILSVFLRSRSRY